MDNQLKNALIVVFGLAGIANLVTLLTTNLFIIRLVETISIIMLISINIAIIVKYASTKKVPAK